ITPAVLKVSAPQISPVLALMFSRFLIMGRSPEHWKLCSSLLFRRLAVYRPTKSTSYRQISVTSIVCRTIERVVSKELIEYLEQNTQLSIYKFGFRPGRSCASALALAAHILSDLIDSRMPCQVLQIDFRQAFHRVNHVLLVEKLTLFRVHGHLIRWLTDFIAHCQFQVLFHGCRSES
ncbi:reverse transcriptase, putative, partial [Ixodes scapularis]